MTSIPVVDVSDNNKNAPQELLEAASKYGFVYVQNYEAGINPADIERIFSLSKDFFSQPLSVKEQAAISSNEAGSNVGWLKQGVEKLDPATQRRPDVKEALNVSVPLLKSSKLPEPILSHADLILQFQHSCQALCLRILQHFGTALEIQPDWFASRHDQALDKSGVSGTILRMLYYPSLANSSSSTTGDDITTADVRAGAHSDYGSITLLFQRPGQPGLEIRNHDGTWSSVAIDPANAMDQGKPLPILVNIGDLLEDWTAGLLKSTVHRVGFPADAYAAGDRYSIAYFCHPLDDVLLEPVPSRVVENRADGKKEVNGMTAKQHLQNRLAASYKIGGE